MKVCWNCSVVIDTVISLHAFENLILFFYVVLACSQGVRGNDGPNGPKGNLVGATTSASCDSQLISCQEIISAHHIFDDI